MHNSRTPPRAHQARGTALASTAPRAPARRPTALILPTHVITPIQQDAWVVKERLASQDAALFGVFDGHGPYGHDISNFCQQNVPR